MKIMKPKMILFDCGGTLISEIKQHNHKGVSALFSIIESNPDNITESDFEQFFFITMKEARNLAGNNIEINNCALLKYVLDYFSIKLSLSIEQAEIYILNAMIDFCQINDADKMLKSLDMLNIRKGIITNVSWSYKALKMMLDSIFPEHQFEMVISSSEYFFRKPDRHIFEIALRKAQLEPQDVWFVGNEYDADIIGADYAGMIPVLFSEESSNSKLCEHNGDIYLNSDYLIISKWSEFTQILLSLS